MPTLPNISPELLQKYQEQILNKTSSSTAKRKMSSLRKFFGWAQEKGHIEENPFPQVITPDLGQMETVVLPETENEPKRRFVFSNFLKISLLAASVIIIFLLLSKTKLTIPFKLAPASETTTTQTNVNQSQNQTAQQAIILSPWTVFAKMKISQSQINSASTQTTTFGLYKTENDSPALWTSESKQITPDTNGDILIPLSNIPTSLFFENEKLFLSASIGSTEVTSRIPVSTANRASNLQGYYPATSSGAVANTIPVISSDGSLLLASEAPGVKAPNGNLLIEGQTVTISTPTASDGNIEINPDGGGIVRLLFEGNNRNFLNAQAPNLTNGSLYYGVVANNATSYDLLRLQSGSKPTTRFSVDATGNTDVAGQLSVGGDILTSDITRLTSTGALTNISGYSQNTGNFSITQTGGQTASIAKTGTALSDVLTLSLDERNKPTDRNSIYSTLTLKRYDGAKEAMALLVDEGNAQFDGQMRLGRFSSNPDAIGTGSMVFNTSDNKVYVWDGSTWSVVGAGTGTNYWQDLSGVISPLTGTDNFAVGGTDSTSPFYVNNSGIISKGTWNGTAIDISSYTNLSATSGIVLTGDQLTHSTSNGYIHIPQDGASTQILQYSSAGTAKWITLSSDISVADNGAVTIQSNAVQGTDISLASEATGDIMYFDGTDWVVLAKGSTGQILQTGTSPSWTDLPAGSTNYWEIGSGSLYPVNTTLDLLIGATSTASAKFGFLNVGSGIPTASISGTTGSLYLTANGSLATTDSQNLTIGGLTTGNITLTPLNGTGTITFSGYGTGLIHSNASGVLSSSAVNLASGDVTELLPLANGGTNKNMSVTQGGVVWTDADSMEVSAAGVAGQVLTSSGTGAPSWVDVNSLVTNYWDQGAGILYPKNATVDLLIGGTSTSAANFAFINNAGGTPTATIAGDLVLSSAGGVTRSITGTAGNPLSINSLVVDSTGTITTGVWNGTDIDISDYTNLSATSGIILTGDQLTHSTANGYIHIPQDGASTQILQYSSAGTAKWITVSSDVTIADNGAVTIANNAVQGTDISLASEAAGDIMYFDGTDWVRLAKGTTAQLLHSGNTPSWSAVSLTADVSGILPLANGGTNKNMSVTQGGVVWTDADSMEVSAAGIAGQLLQSNGTSAPSWIDPASVGTNFWNQTSVLYPINPSVDLLIGSDATSSAKFGFLNVSSGIPTASISGTTGSLYLTANGSLATTDSQNLTIGGLTTGNITLTPLNGIGTVTFSGYGTGLIHSNASGVLSSSAVNLASADITGVLPLASGGTNKNMSVTEGGVVWVDADSMEVSAAGIAGQLLQSNGTSAPSWIDSNAVGTNYWTIGSGVIYPNNSTLDLSIGGTATSSAKFEFTGVTGGTPTASISGTTANVATFIDGNGNISTTNRQNLVLGNSTTYNTSGNILLNPNGTGGVGIGDTSPLATLTVGDGDLFQVAGATGNITTAGTLAVNGDSITADGATLIINAAGNVDVQDALNADNITTDMGGVSIAAGQSYTGAGAVTLLPGGAASLTLGGTSTTDINLTTDGTGNAEVVLPNDSIGPNEVFSAGQTDEYCLTYEATGTTWEWQSCGSSGGSNWTIDSGTLYPNNSTLDVFFGGTATSSAKFAFTGISGGTPTASISGTTANVTTYLTGEGTLSTTNMQNLVLGTATTGDILFNPGGGDVIFSNNTTLNIGGSGSDVAYNAIADSLTGASVNMTSDQDLYIGGNLEVDGTIYDSAGNVVAGYWTLSSGKLYTTTTSNLVGIGTNNPLGKLHVSGGNGGNASLIVDQTLGGDIMTASAAGETKMTLQNDGTLKLVNATSSITNDSGDITIDAASNLISFAGDSLSNINTVTAGTGILTSVLQVANSSAAVYSRFGSDVSGHGLNAGNDVLISGDLELNGILYLDGLNIANNASPGTATIIFSNTPGNVANTLSAGNWLIENTANVGQAALMVNQTFGGDLFTASASGTPKFVISNAGDVGLGILAPTAKLDISGDASASGSLVLRGNSPDTIDILNGSRLDFQTSVGGDAGLTARMTILNAGNVGIGTVNPLAGFVNNNGSALFQTSRDAITSATVWTALTNLEGLELAYDATNNRGRITSVESNTAFRDLSIQANSISLTTGAATQTERITITNAGNVGVGCADPDHLLELGGTGAGCNTGTGSWIAAGSTAFTANSSREWKDNIQNFNVSDILTKFQNTKPRTFDWKSEYCSGTDCTNNLGFIAQEFYPILQRGDDKHVNGQDIMIANWLATQALIDLTNSNSVQIASLSGQLADATLNDTGELDIQINTNATNSTDKQSLASNTKYQLTNNGTIMDKIGAFAQIVAANIKAGAIESKDFIAENLIALQGTIDNLLIKGGLVSPVIETKTISPLADSDITIDLKRNQTSTDENENVATESGFGKLIIKGENDQTVASVDATGNASFSGQLSADSVVSNQLLVGKLYADEIISRTGTFADLISASSSGITREEVEELLKQAQEDQQTLTQNTNSNIFTATDSASLKELALENLYVTNTAAMNTLSLSSSLAIGTDMVLSSSQDTQYQILNTINSISAPLQIQSLALAPVELMAGKMRIETNGDVIINGNLFVAGNIESTGLTLKPNQDVQTNGFGDLLNLKGIAGENVASIDASGSAKFKTIQTDGLVIAGAQNASESAVAINGVIETNTTAGKATIPVDTENIMIKNPKITDYTLVYVTPTSTTLNNVLYVKSKGPGYFTVGFSQPLLIDVEFNWWVIDIAKQY